MFSENVLITLLSTNVQKLEAQINRGNFEQCDLNILFSSCKRTAHSISLPLFFCVTCIQ